MLTGDPTLIADLLFLITNHPEAKLGAQCQLAPETRRRRRTMASAARSESGCNKTDPSCPPQLDMAQEKSKSARKVLHLPHDILTGERQESARIALVIAHSRLGRRVDE